MIQLPSNLNNPLFIALFFVLLFIQVFLLIRYVCWYIKAKSWVKACAKLIKCELKKGSIKDDSIDTLSISYMYKVGGKEYVNSKIALTDYACSWLVNPSRNLVKKIYLKSKFEASIDIFYEKENPKNSCIDLGLDYRVLIFSTISFMFFVALILDSLGIFKFTF